MPSPKMKAAGAGATPKKRGRPPIVKGQLEAAAAKGLPGGWRVRTYSNPSGTKIHDFLSPSGRTFTSLLLVKAFLTHAKGRAAKANAPAGAEEALTPQKAARPEEVRSAGEAPPRQPNGKEASAEHCGERRSGTGIQRAESKDAPVAAGEVPPPPRPVEDEDNVYWRCPVPGCPASNKVVYKGKYQWHTRSYHLNTLLHKRAEAAMHGSVGHEGKSPRSERNREKSKTAGGKSSTPPELEDTKKVYWRCPIPGCRVAGRVVYFGTRHCQQRYAHLHSPVHKRAMEAAAAEGADADGSPHELEAGRTLKRLSVQQQAQQHLQKNGPAEGKSPRSEEDKEKSKTAGGEPGTPPELQDMRKEPGEGKSPRSEEDKEKSKTAGGEPGTPLELEDMRKVYWQCPLPGCCAARRVVYFGTRHYQQKYTHLNSSLHKRAVEAAAAEGAVVDGSPHQLEAGRTLKRLSEQQQAQQHLQNPIENGPAEGKSSRSEDNKEKPKTAGGESGTPLELEDTKKVYWRCPIPGCRVAGRVVYFGTRHCQQRYAHLHSPVHKRAMEAAAAEDAAADGFPHQLEDAPPHKRLKQQQQQQQVQQQHLQDPIENGPADGSEDAAEEDGSKDAAEEAADDAAFGAVALALKPRAAPFLAAPCPAMAGGSSVEQAALVAPMTVEELQAMGEEFRALLREQGFGSHPELIGVTGCGSPAASRWMTGAFRGVFVRMPRPVAGRPCYQKVKQRAAGVAEVMLIDVYIVWDATSARWRIGDRPSQRGGRSYARSSMDWRRPPLGEVRGKWDIRTPDGAWEQDPALMTLQLGKEAAQ